jgi:uncharacterized protein (DUF983 family)
MDLRLTCPRCGQKLVLDDAAIGAEVPCPTCGHLLTVPNAVFSRRLLIVIAGVVGLIFIIWTQWSDRSLTSEDFWSVFGTVVVIASAGVLYFFPSFVGRNKRNSSAILVLNFFLGWTLLGWVIALVWAVTKDPDR